MVRVGLCAAGAGGCVVVVGILIVGYKLCVCMKPECIVDPTSPPLVTPPPSSPAPAHSLVTTAATRHIPGVVYQAVVSLVDSAGGHIQVRMPPQGGLLYEVCGGRIQLPCAHTRVPFVHQRGPVLQAVLWLWCVISGVRDCDQGL
jgi:hypothetical protein